MRTTLRMRKKTKQGYRQLNFTSRKTPQTTTHLKADCQVPTWSTTTRDAHFAEARCATRGTGCLPIDSLLQIDSLCIGHFTTMNLERKKHREWTALIALSGSPTQTGDTEKARVRPQNKGRQKPCIQYLDTLGHVRDRHDTSRKKFVRGQHDTSRTEFCQTAT